MFTPCHIFIYPSNFLFHWKLIPVTDFKACLKSLHIPQSRMTIDQEHCTVFRCLWIDMFVASYFNHNLSSFLLLLLKPDEANCVWNSKSKICRQNSLCAWLLALQKCFCVWQFPFSADDHVWENGAGYKSKPSDDMRFYGSMKTSQQPQYHQLSDICMIALIHTISCFLPTFQKWWFKVLFYHHWSSYPGGTKVVRKLKL